MRSIKTLYLKLLKALLWVAFIHLATPAFSLDIEFTEEEQAFIKQHPIITVGGETDWPPFDFVENGQYTGVANDYLKILEASTGLKFDVVTGYSWDEMIPLLREKTIDMLPVLYKTNERTELAKFTFPYLRVRHYAFTTEGNTRFKNMADLSTSMVAIQKGDALIGLLKKRFPNIQILEVENPLAAIDAVITGQADALVENKALISHLLKSNGLNGIQAAFVTDTKTNALHMAVRKDWGVLRDILEKGLLAISPRQKSMIAQRWVAVGSKDAGAALTLLNDEETEYLRKKKRLKTCVDPDWMPLEQIRDGEYIGMGSDYLKLFVTKLNTPIDVVFSESWAESKLKARSRECDMLMLSSDSATRRQYMNISNPYLRLPLVVAARSNELFVPDLSHLWESK